MAYSIERSDPTKGVVTVQDNQIEGSSNPALSIDLVGRNAIDYGDNIAQTQIKLLENFAAPTAPPNPIPGQLWFDNSLNQLNVNTGSTDGAAGAVWTPVGSGGGGVTFFTSLTDTPSNYTGQGGLFLRVNASETGIEFVTGTGAGGLNAVADDLSPSLGGDLDTGANRILTSDASENVVIQRACKIESTAGTSPGFFLTDIDVSAATNRPTVIIAGGGPLGGGEATMRMQFSDRLNVGDTAVKPNQTFFGADENGTVFIEAPGAINPGTQALRFQTDGNIRRDANAADPVDERDLITRGFQGPRILAAFVFNMSAGSFIGNPYGVETAGGNAPVRTQELASGNTIAAGAYDFYLPELDVLNISDTTNIVSSVTSVGFGTIGVGYALGAAGTSGTGSPGRLMQDGWITVGAYNGIITNDDILNNPGGTTNLFGPAGGALGTPAPDDMTVQVIVYDAYNY